MDGRVVVQWHNYGHSTIGEKSDIEGAPIERLQAFYRTYYQPDNAVLVVAGTFGNVIMALLYNLISEVVGGLKVSLGEDDKGRRSV